MTSHPLPLRQGIYKDTCAPPQNNFQRRAQGRRGAGSQGAGAYLKGAGSQGAGAYLKGAGSQGAGAQSLSIKTGRRATNRAAGVSKTRCGAAEMPPCANKGP